MTFDSFGLHPSLLQVLPEIGYEKPTPIQAQAIPLVMRGGDVLGSAQTGTGKTAAFLLPILHRLLSEGAQGTQVLVLEPTRELALQVEENAKMFSAHTPLRAACVYGGVGFEPQVKAFKDGVEIIAATPGRLLDHLRQGNVRFDKLKVLVLDEADRMLDMGFLPDIRAILRQLPEQRQTLFFSATLPGEIVRLTESMLKDPARVDIAPERKTAEGITQQIYPVADHLKAKLLERLLLQEHVSTALVFTRTKMGADRVCAVAERQGLSVTRIHGDLSQAARMKALEQFKNGEVKFLVATDVAARGIDVEGISAVINFDLPDSAEDYTHRIGRTARAGATGHAYSLCGPREAGYLAAIERHLGQKIEKVTMPEFDYEEKLGLQHEVRQGHNVRDFDDLGRPGAAPQPARARGFKDADERASLVLLYSADAEESEAESAPSGRGAGQPGFGSSGSGSGRGGDGEGGGEDRGRRRRRGRGGRGGEGREGQGESRPQGGQARREGGREGREEGRRDRHSANAAISATDVLRRASSQEAVVGSDMMDLRPRGEDEAGEAEGAQAGAPREGGEGGGKKRRRRRRGRGGRGGEGQGGENRPQGQLQGGRQGQPQGGRQGQREGGQRQEPRGERGRGQRPERRDRQPGGEQRPAASKPSLWQRLKSGLGLGSSGGGGGFGDKW